ncbi:protein MALE DISCOVERER 2 [Canna indica]|uniref:Protein MALE DISCOVERER 2 n=1 Tax=Canna indica TaxID=4628 RepID=A0AAQ3JKW6_9LILI|nr:protein MALE DISCOVERER 2 [Canna indica]
MLEILEINASWIQGASPLNLHQNKPKDAAKFCFNVQRELDFEGLALLEFRSRVESDPYGALKNWNTSGSSPCNWTGVRCVDGNVVTLILKEYSLRGTLVPELGKLCHLKALVLHGNNFSGVIPKEIGGLTMLELLDLRNNMLNGTIPSEIGEIPSLKHLLLCHNRFDGNIPKIENPNMHFDLHDPNISCDINDLVHVNRKVKHCFWETGWQKLKDFNSFLIPLKGRIIQVFDLALLKGLCLANGQIERNDGPVTDLGKPHITSNVHVHTDRRRLAEETRNIHAAPGSSGPVPQVVSVPPIASGSFPAIRDRTRLKPSPPPMPPSSPSVSPFIPHPEPTPATSTDSVDNDPSSSKKSATWTYLLVLPVAALLLTLATCMFLVCRSKGAATIGPWKTGLSGQLQKAFVTAGVPKLKRAELDAACEDFSNIVLSYPEYIIYKGTLSSGVEIAVVSTSITSTNDWSKHSEMLFRKKIDTLSRTNHKNFVNLLGYCEEDEPFMRMMVLEYAPNGTLYEHLHGEELEHLDWSARMRIIMGIAYCLQHMHELNPPVAHPNLLSSTILVSEDYAAKIADVCVWKEIFAKVKKFGDDDLDQSQTLPADPASNVYSFGVLLLEIISGKISFSEEHTSLLSMVAEYLKGNGGADSLVDPTLKLHKHEELDIICEVIQDCLSPDPRGRPTMNEVISKLRGIIAISPEAATPRLSPLWWAELEILSVEAS